MRFHQTPAGGDRNTYVALAAGGMAFSAFQIKFRGELMGNLTILSTLIALAEK